MRRIATSIVFLAISCRPYPAAATDFAAAIKALEEAKHEVKWDAKTAVVADVTCDGVPDTLVVGYEKDGVWLGVVPGPNAGKSAKLTTTRFSVGKQTQSSFCAVPVRIETDPIECEDEEFGALPGCKRIKGCLAFSLVDDSCDSFHFYWDSSRKKLTWWRR